MSSPSIHDFKNHITEAMLAKPLSGKTAVITGAGGEIGRSIVHLFQLAGATVIALDIDESGLQKTREEFSI